MGSAARPLALAFLLVKLLDRLALDAIGVFESYGVLYALARGDELLDRHAGVVAGALELLQAFLGEVEIDADRESGVDHGGVTHVFELLVAVQRASVAVPAALHVDHRRLGILGRAHRFLVVAREYHRHVGALVGADIDALDRFLVPLDAAGVGARDDDEILVERVALLAGEADLVAVIFDRNIVRDVGMVMRALRKELVFDMHAGDAGAYAFAYGAHGVQRLAPAGAGIHQHRHGDPPDHPLGHAVLLGHGQQRLGDAGRAAGDEAAVIDHVEARVLNQARSNGVVCRRHGNDLGALEQRAS